jgi:23S rRNA (cytosine1962-C5)-methyltransferase
MPAASSYRRPSREDRSVPRIPLAAEHLAQRPLATAAEGVLPEVTVKSPTWHAHLYRKRLGSLPPGVRHGDLVRLRTVEGQSLGQGWLNPRAEIAVRVVERSDAPLDDAWWDRRLQRAIDLRERFLKLPDVATAYRLIHAEGDGVPGIVVDRYGDVLVAEAFTLAAWQRSIALLQRLQSLTGTRHWLVRPGPNTLVQEGFEGELLASDGLPRKLTIREHGVEYEVDLDSGHKTGFFCDQRDNRARLAAWRQGTSLLDLCCYTGGFSVAAAVNGGAGDVTGVDLDETAIAVARRNAQKNRVKTRFVHADAFAYMRDMLRAGKTFETVVLDPPKLINGRDEIEEGRRKYFDFNRLALQLVAPGGLLLTCSCSGLLSMEEFTKAVFSAVPQGRSVQVLLRSGAAPDHPVAGDCPETEYLKALWLRVS